MRAQRLAGLRPGGGRTEATRLWATCTAHEYACKHDEKHARLASPKSILRSHTLLSPWSPTQCTQQDSLEARRPAAQLAASRTSLAHGQGSLEACTAQEPVSVSSRCPNFQSSTSRGSPCQPELLFRRALDHTPGDAKAAQAQHTAHEDGKHTPERTRGCKGCPCTAHIP